MNSRKKFLLVYSFVIIIIFVFIVFLAPDKMFIKSSNAKIEEKKEVFKDYEKQKKNLINGEYNYHFDIDYNSIIYKCKAVYNNGDYTGECSKPKKINYDQNSIKEKLKDIDNNLINPDFIFDSIKDIEYKEEKMYDKRTYTYNVKLYGLEGKIIVYTDYNNIYQISISNGYFTYIIYYDYEK